MPKRRQATLPFPKFFKRHRLRTMMLAGILLACIIALSGFWMLLSSMTLMAPGVIVDGIPVGGKSYEEARWLVESNQPEVPEVLVELSYEETRFATTSASLGLRIDTNKALDQAYAVGRGNHPIENLSDVVRSAVFETQIKSELQFNEKAVRTWVSQIAESLALPGKEPGMELGRSGQPATLSVDPGLEGRIVQTEELVSALLSQTRVPFDPIEIPVYIQKQLAEEEVMELTARGARLVGQTLAFQIDDKEYLVNDQMIISLLQIPNGYNTKAVAGLVSEWKEEIDRAPQEPEITIEDGEVKSFSPPLHGRTIHETEAVGIVLAELQSLENLNSLMLDLELPKASGTAEELRDPVEIPVARVEPRQSLDEMNDLGIKERIGFGESTYYHSIPNRVFNVALTAERINLTLVPPGEVFSFNGAAGEVSARTGYRPAYVIQAGRTVLGDGGGVCQVSTTVFRAALSAGLPITARKGHSYRVAYYEQNSLPGLDATVYAPSVDLKFRNDTPGHILVRTITDTENLYLAVEIWGTSDGRISEITDHIVYDRTPARATVYQDDPSLPVGVTKQVDWSAPGAKASFTYRVQRDGKTLIDETYRTVYQPWAAVFLVGTGGQ